MPEKKSALRRRIAPSVPLTIEYTDDRGAFSQIYLVSFNLNVLAEISEKTGLAALSFDIWTRLSASVLRAMLWAALLPYQPEFAAPEGLEVVGSMLDGSNQERAVAALWEAYLLYLPKDQADLLRKERAEAESKPVPLASPEPQAAAPEIPTSDGSTSGPSADTTSDLPKAPLAG